MRRHKHLEKEFVIDTKIKRNHSYLYYTKTSKDDTVEVWRTGKNPTLTPEGKKQLSLAEQKRKEEVAEKARLKEKERKRLVEAFKNG